MEKVKVNFEAWIQLLGMVGVLGGLVFVGLEMQQTQQIAIAGQTQARNQQQLDFFLGVLTTENEALRTTMRDNINQLDYADLPQEEADVLRYVRTYRSITLQNAFQQYSVGLLPEDVWQQVEQRILFAWGSCSFRPSFNGIIPSFREYLESLPVEDCAE